ERSANNRGAVFVELAEAFDVPSMHAAFAAALDVPLQGARPDDDRAALTRALQSRGPSLVVIDDAECVARDLCAALVAMARKAPAAWILVTSRVRLDLPFEQVLEIAPLATPAEGDLRSESVDLLVARARAAGWTGSPSDQAEDLAALARALEGIPLA